MKKMGGRLMTLAEARLFVKMLGFKNARWLGLAFGFSLL